MDRYSYQPAEDMKYMKVNGDVFSTLSSASSTIRHLQNPCA